MTALLLEHKPLTHLCPRCFDGTYLAYETKLCPHYGHRFTEPKVVVPVPFETVLVGKMAFAAYEGLRALEDTWVLGLLEQIGGTT